MERTDLLHDLAGYLGDLAELRRHAGGIDNRLPAAAHHERAGEHQVPAVKQLPLTGGIA